MLAMDIIDGFPRWGPALSLKDSNAFAFPKLTIGLKKILFLKTAIADIRTLSSSVSIIV